MKFTLKNFTDSVKALNTQAVKCNCSNVSVQHPAPHLLICGEATPKFSIVNLSFSIKKRSIPPFGRILPFFNFGTVILRSGVRCSAARPFVLLLLHFVATSGGERESCVDLKPSRASYCFRSASIVVA